MYSNQRDHLRSGFAAAFVAVLSLLSLPLAAQNLHANPAKEVKFEVVSLRPMEMQMGVAMNTAPSPNGFDSRLSLWQMIMVAYDSDDYVNWGTVELLNAPKWIGDFYDIRARVSQADLPAWQSQGSSHPLLRSAMRKLLKERCNLAIHEQPSQGQIWEMVVAKSGPRLKVSGPNAVLPFGMKMPGGGVIVQTQANDKAVNVSHGVSMSDLAWYLSIISKPIPVRDKTGLTGRYDFTFREVQIQPDEEHIYKYPLNQLGLQIRRGTENRPKLVLDHIEKPAPN
jgi:uncharacterized protein (TIGR03435 family)